MFARDGDYDHGPFCSCQLDILDELFKMINAA